MPTLKSNLQRIPFIRIAGLFISGVFLSHWIRLDELWIEIVLIPLLSTLILLWHNKHYQGIKIQNILISMSLVVSGIYYPYTASEEKPSITDNKDVYIAELCEKPSQKTNSYQSVLLVKSKRFSQQEKIIAYFSKKQFDTTLVAGDQLILYTTLQEIKAKANTFDFDYKALMRNKGIFYSVYLSPESYHKTGIRSNKVIYVAERLRDQLTRKLYQTGLKNDELAVVSALTLGYRSKLDRETMNCFTDTGTIHVLSVSGLHVALVYYILTLFFIPFKRGNWVGSLYPLLIIICLWCYAFITGFSPSVQRSTVMFSFVIVGSALRRPVNIYNSLMASALVLILLDPHVLWDIGFQLSYLAIFGIVLLQPPLENLIPIKNKSLKWLWTLFTVSLAAQIITFPLSIYYFKQFPNLFWLSNFVAIPGTTIIIWLTLLFFFFSPIASLSNFLASAIQAITHLLLFILKWMSQLPHAVSEGIVFSSHQTLFLYGLIFALIIFCFTKNKKWLLSGLFFLILFQTSTLLYKYDLFNQKIVYQYHGKSSIIHCINGRNNYILRVEKMPFDDQEIQLIQNVCYHLKLNKPEVIILKNNNHYIRRDIVVRDHMVNFLNCQLKFDDPSTFTIKGKDLPKFRQNNPTLNKKSQIHYNLNQRDFADHKISFSAQFMIQFNEPVCIFIN